MVARRLQRPTLARLVAVSLVVTGSALVIGRFSPNGLDRMGLFGRFADSIFFRPL
jgi:hypothetical protein